MKPFHALIILAAVFSSCTASRNYSPAKKYAAEQLREDYRYFRNILEESHPSLYWYTSKDSMDFYFEQGEQKLRDSMQEYQFRNVLSYVISKIRCGHTTVRPSKGAAAYAERTRSVSFPLGIKAWPDTAVVTFNMNRKDSTVLRGVILLSIENRSIQQVIDSLFQHLSTDGFNTTHKYQLLSNGSNFRNLYNSIFGLRSKMKVDFIDMEGNFQSATLEVYNPAADTPAVRVPAPRLSARERKKRVLAANRNLRIDTARSLAVMEVNTFTKNFGLRKFFRQSFRKMQQENIQHLVLDLRGNGGGSVVLSNLLTRYLSKTKFKIADSIYSFTNRSSYKHLISSYWANRIFYLLMTRKSSEGRYHFRMYEDRYFKPRKKHHFDGRIFVLTGGNTFSAATLVTKSLQGQDNVLVVGEETGGGAYGNTAWLIPNVTLPHTGVRFRLPLFRLIIDRNEIKGRGIMPDLPSIPTVEAIRNNEDFKMKAVLQLIDSTRR